MTWLDRNSRKEGLKSAYRRERQRQIRSHGSKGAGIKPIPILAQYEEIATFAAKQTPAKGFLRRMFSRQKAG